jgi:hypothetical protein
MSHRRFSELVEEVSIQTESRLPFHLLGFDFEAVVVPREGNGAMIPDDDETLISFQQAEDADEDDPFGNDLDEDEETDLTLPVYLACDPVGGVQVVGLHRDGSITQSSSFDWRDYDGITKEMLAQLDLVSTDLH